MACAALITLSGCQKDEVGPEMEEAVLAFDDQKFQITDVNEMENPVITDASESTAFSATHTDTRPETHKLTYILKRLNLNERQKAAVQKFVAQHEECVAEHRSRVQQYHEELLKKANAIREEHISAYKAGSISKQELERRLSVLRERLKEEIKKHHDRQVHLQNMRRCRANLFAKIESILGPEQLAKWTHWKKHL